MARYYGTVQGERGEATRLGRSKLEVSAQSYNGDVCVTFRRGGTDEDIVHIYVRRHDAGSYVTLYHGNIADLLSMDARHAKLKLLGIDEFLKRHEEGAE